MEYVDGNRNMKYRNYDFEIISLIDSPNKTEDEESKSVVDIKLPLARTNTSSAAPVTSHTGHNSLVTSHTGHNSLVTSHTGYTSPVTSHTGYTSPVTSHTGYTSPVTSHTCHNSPLKPHHNTKQLQPLTFHFTANTDLQDGCIWRRKIKTEEIRNVFSPQLQGPVGYGDVQPILDPALIPYFQRCHDQTEYPPIVITPIDYQSYHVIDPRKAEVGLDSGGATQSAEQLGLEEDCHILPPGVSTQKVCQVSKLSGYQGNGVKSGNHGNSSKTINPNHAGRPCNHGAGVTPGNHDNPPFKIKEEAPQEGVDSGRGSQTCSTVTKIPMEPRK